MTASKNTYEESLRGHRVPPMTSSKIEAIAKEVVQILKINKKTIKEMDSFIDNLWHKYRINIDVISDTEWLGVANALCDPSSITIAIPESLYKQLVKKRRSKSDFKALHIFFHELGHLLLAHKPVLHQTNQPPTKIEDSEWQADYFSDVILESLGEQEYKQLSLF